MPAPNNSRRIALCGLLGALGTAILTLGSVIPLATFCLPVLASLALLPALDACGGAMTVGLYAVISLLSLLLSPDKEAAWLFLLLGYYPIIKGKLDGLRFRLLQILCKLAFFNVVIVAGYWLLARILGLPELASELASYSTGMTALLLLMGNAVFILYDLALLRLQRLYRKRLQSQVRRMLGSHS